MATIIDGWTILGLYYIQKSDSFYGVIQDAIKSGNVTQNFLQKKMGFRAPIIVDPVKKIIEFCSW